VNESTKVLHSKHTDFDINNGEKEKKCFKKLCGQSDKTIHASSFPTTSEIIEF
jgi:hypothetical protein